MFTYSLKTNEDGYDLNNHIKEVGFVHLLTKEKNTMEAILYQNKFLYIFHSLSIQNIQVSLVIQCEIHEILIATI